MLKRTPSVRERLVAPWMLLFTVSVSYGASISNDVQQHFQAQAISDVVAEERVATEVVEVEQDAEAGQPAPTPLPTPQPTATPLPTTLTSTDEIKSYIHEVFGDQGQLAVAVGMSESHLISDRTLIADAGHHEWSSPTYKGECSIGLFMINLSSDGCNGKKVHYDAVPGNTLEEKIEWLKDPKNNTDFAKKIYDSRGNFSAWSGYTGGGYKKFIK